MSQYTSTIRTSYFKARSGEQFRRFCESFGLTPSDRVDAEHGRLHAFTLESGEQSTLTSFYDETRAEDVPADVFLEEMSRHLAQGWSVVITEIGSDGTKALKGRSTVVNWEGESRFVDLQDVYRLAPELKGRTTPCED